MPKPVLGSQIIQDTFEKLGDLARDATGGLKDLVTGGNDQKSDSGIEQLSGQPDPQSGGALAQPGSAGQGTDPQRLAQKRAEEQKTAQFHRDQVKKWGEDYKRIQEEEMAEKQEKGEEEKKKEEQEIIQLRQEEAKAATLQGSSKPKQGRGTAFLPPSAKQSMGTGELSKTPTN